MATASSYFLGIALHQAQPFEKQGAIALFTAAIASLGRRVDEILQSCDRFVGLSFSLENVYLVVLNFEVLGSMLIAFVDASRAFAKSFF